MDVDLLVEPIVVRLPSLTRVRKADMEDPNNLRDQLIDLAQRDLRNVSLHAKVHT